MKYIGIITIIFEVLTILFLSEDYKNKRIEKKSFVIAICLCTIALIGMVTLTVMNW